MRKILLISFLSFVTILISLFSASQVNAETRNVWMNDGTCNDEGFDIPGSSGGCWDIPAYWETSEFTSCGSAGSRMRWTREESTSRPGETQDTMREDRMVTYNVMKCRTITLGNKLWVKWRVWSAGSKWHAAFCKSKWHIAVTSDAGWICASGENRPWTYNYRVLGLWGTPNRWWDFIQRDDGSNRCYKTGQKKDDDRSDKDVWSLCQEYQITDTDSPPAFCEAWLTEASTPRDCPAGQSWEITTTRTCNTDGSAWWDDVDNENNCEDITSVCTAWDTENGSTRSCPAWFNGEETSSRTCNADGSAWWDYVWDDSGCVAQVCTPNSTENGSTRSCPAWFNGEETSSRTCNSDGTAWWDYVWNNSWCLENTCTPDDVTTESVACGSGYTGNQTRTNTCNSSGTGYLWWTEYNRDNCVANECSPWEVGDELRACPTWFTGNETRDRTCDGTWSWWGWSDWNNSWCVADVCTANEVATETTACGSGYTWNQTRTNTCNGDGTAWNGWTSYDRTSCVENTPPTGTVSYTPAWPGWTTSDVVVAITCDDVGSGCDMVSSFPASWTYVDANTRSYTYSSNITSSVVLRDNAGNSTFIPYNIDYIDQSTPWAPTIAADDRWNNQWSDDNTTVVTTTINNTGEISSRYNQYCTDLSAGCTPSVTTPPSTTNLSDGIYYYRARTCTQAGRCGPIAEFIIKVDTTAPVASDLSVVPGMSGPLLANDNQNFQVTAWNAGGSNIVSIEGLFENYATENSYFTTPVVSTSDVLSFNGSTQLVDNNRSPQWYRNYQLYIYEICDEAGNCTREIDVDGIETFEYQVYPNTTALWVADVTINELDDTANIADGWDKEIIVTIEDVYWNNIIPASGIGRNISFDFTTDNSLYLNQYTRSGTSALYNGSNPWPIGNNLSRTFANQSSSDGTYDFSFSAYTPTYQYTHADPSARFDIGSIQADISWTLWAVSNINITNSNIESRFAPLYTTNFGWELPNNWFIEWAQQNSDISVAKAVSPETPSPKVLALQYGWETDRLRLDISRSWDPDTAVSEIDLSTILENNFGNTTYPFNTLLTQEGWTIEDISQTFLSSHISYTLDGRDVVYNWDVIGKDNYHDTDIDNTTSQSGIKVVWLTSWERTTALTDDQFSDDVTILWKLTKSTSRKDIQSSVFSVIKWVAPENGSNRITRLDSLGWSNNTDGKKLVNDSVLYFKNSDTDATNFELWNWSNEIVGWKKTIVVEGWNLYIRSNMSYADTDNDILGIVVLQDEQWRWWNLYIHPDVTNIVGTIYVDKSVISYNDIEWELDGNTRAEILRNQLYIFGSLFSENTIWGSRDIDEEWNPICPYYMSRSDCETSVEAQKYDLNYLRRYFVADSDNDGIKDTPSWNIGVPSTHSNYANYYQFPVVVEYNSRIQSTPPPLFD